MNGRSRTDDAIRQAIDRLTERGISKKALALAMSPHRNKETWLGQWLQGRENRRSISAEMMDGLRAYVDALTVDLAKLRRLLPAVSQESGTAPSPDALSESAVSHPVTVGHDAGSHGTSRTEDQHAEKSGVSSRRRKPDPQLRAQLIAAAEKAIDKAFANLEQGHARPRMPRKTSGKSGTRRRRTS